MKYIKPFDEITASELDALQFKLGRFYENPPEHYHLAAHEANTDWSDESHFFHRRIVAHAFSGASVLDIGCGPASSCAFFYEKQADYTGIDISEEQIGLNRKKYPDAHFIRSRWADIPKLESKYDIVTSFFVLEHIVYPKAFLEASVKAVKPGGLLAVLCPDFLKRGFIPSLHIYGDKAGGIKTKVVGLDWKDAFVESWNRFIMYPRLIKRARKLANYGGLWLINLRPLCLESSLWNTDWDAVYFASEDEISSFLSGIGYKIIERGDMFRINATYTPYPEFSYVLARGPEA